MVSASRRDALPVCRLKYRGNQYMVFLTVLIILVAVPGGATAGMVRIGASTYDFLQSAYAVAASGGIRCTAVLPGTGRALSAHAIRTGSPRISSRNRKVHAGVTIWGKLKEKPFSVNLRLAIMTHYALIVARAFLPPRRDADKVGAFLPPRRDADKAGAFLPPRRDAGDYNLRAIF